MSCPPDFRGCTTNVLSRRVDYWIIRKGNLHVPSLYSTETSSPYWYFRGFNLRAFGSWIAAIALVIPGVSGSINPGSIGMAAVHIYSLGFLLSTTFAGVLFYASHQIWPVEIYPPQYSDRSKTWEAMRHTEGFFPEDTTIPTYVIEGGIFDGETASIEKGEAMNSTDVRAVS